MRSNASLRVPDLFEKAIKNLLALAWPCRREMMVRRDGDNRTRMTRIWQIIADFSFHRAIGNQNLLALAWPCGWEKPAGLKHDERQSKPFAFRRSPFADVSRDLCDRCVKRLRERKYQTPNTKHQISNVEYHTAAFNYLNLVGLVDVTRNA
jgi:hypothetical protein